jgi:PKD repeat protein
MFDWNFGDGGSSTQEYPSHLFENMTAANEDYTVRLISTTLNQCRDTSWQVIRVHPYINADFSVDNFQGCAPFTVTLQNSSVGRCHSTNELGRQITIVKFKRATLAIFAKMQRGWLGRCDWW